MAQRSISGGGDENVLIFVAALFGDWVAHLGGS
jgi:hypothetical protein